MATVQISKIQLRRGFASDLPGAALAPGLDDGELGFTTDTGRVFVGQSSPTNGLANYNRLTFPYQNVEVLTENTIWFAPEVFQPLLVDNRTGFVASVPLSNGGPTTLQTYDQSMVAQNFDLDLPVSGANCTISYYVFASDQTAMRQGVINVVWTSTMIAPTIIDTHVVGVGLVGDLVWTAIWDGSHVLLQYTFTAGIAPYDTATVYFRIDRPIVG